MPLLKRLLLSSLKKNLYLNSKMVSTEMLNQFVLHIRELGKLDARRISKFNIKIRQLFDTLAEDAELPNMVRLVQSFEQQFSAPGVVVEVDTLDDSLSTGSDDSGPIAPNILRISNTSGRVRANTNTWPVPSTSVLEHQPNVKISRKDSTEVQVWY